MPPDGKKPKAERQQTDESLRLEREKTDRALSARQATAEDDADEIVQRARDNADAVLSVARDKADQQIEAATVDTTAAVAVAAVAAAAVVQERELEDEALRNERASADASIRRQREETARALSSLLPLEREKTDRFLLTERVRSDAAITHRDDFLGIVSHDLRNLLGGIVSSASLLEHVATDKDHLKHTLAGTTRIQRYAARMNRLIGDLVDVASIDAGKLEFTAAPSDTGALIAEAIEMFRAAAVDKGITLKAAPSEYELIANFDHDRLLQVLANLITNALKFTEPGGAITLEAARASNDVLVRVTDTGIGVPHEMLESIFERFWQVGKNDRRGVGLGLYISRCLVEAHGGQISASSKLAEGTTISFTLPAASARRAVV